MVSTFKVQLKVKGNATPYFFKSWPVPSALQEAVDRKLACLKNWRVLRSENTSEWVALIVVVQKKDGTLSLSGDYKVTINQALSEAVLIN